VCKTVAADVLRVEASVATCTAARLGAHDTRATARCKCDGEKSDAHRWHGACSVPPRRARTMSKLLRGAVAGVGAWKLGGGLFGTILVFVLLWWVLGYFGIFQ
jgi:hypothetical protein